MSGAMTLRGAMLGLALSTACSGSASQPAAEQPAEPVVVGEASDPAPRPPPLPVALRALRPEVEIVPDLHGRGAVVRGSASVHDGERVRALHRLALSSAPHARTEDSIFVGVAPHAASTIDAVLAWDLRTDTVTRVAGLRRPEGVVGLGALGVVVSAEGEDLVRRQYLLRQGAPPEEAPPQLSTVSDAAVIDGATYLFRADGDRLAISRLTSLAPLREEAVSVVDGSLWRDETTEAVVVMHTEGARLELRRAPFTDASHLDLGADVTLIDSFDAGHVHVITSEQLVDVEVATSVLRRSPLTAEALLIAVTIGSDGPRSLHELRLTDSSLLVRSRDRAFVLDAQGARPAELDAATLEDVAPEQATPEEATPAERACTCDGEMLVCPTERVAAACLDLPELDALHIADELPPRTQLAPEGRFRVDRIEPDLARVTRLADGARLWIRILTNVLVVQADDGAFWVSSETLAPTCSVRWGRSILESPVTSLEADRAALHRPTLVSAFFAGEALPAAARPSHLGAR